MTSNKLVWSNVIFLVPLVFAICWSVSWYAGAVLLSATFSFAYHHSRERSYKRVDLALALTLIFSNFILLFGGSFKPVGVSLAALFMAVIALYFYFSQHKDYRNYHSMYHILSAAVCTLCLIVFHY